MGGCDILGEARFYDKRISLEDFFELELVFGGLDKLFFIRLSKS